MDAITYSMILHDMLMCEEVAELEGLLLGTCKAVTSVQLKDHGEVSTTKNFICVDAFIATGRFLSFYSAAGCVNSQQLDAVLRDYPGKRIVGWYRFRRDLPPAATVRETAVHRSLLEYCGTQAVSRAPLPAEVAPLLVLDDPMQAALPVRPPSEAQIELLVGAMHELGDAQAEPQSRQQSGAAEVVGTERAAAAEAAAADGGSVERAVTPSSLTSAGSAAVRWPGGTSQTGLPAHSGAAPAAGRAGALGPPSPGPSPAPQAVPAPGALGTSVTEGSGHLALLLGHHSTDDSAATHTVLLSALSMTGRRWAYVPVVVAAAQLGSESAYRPVGLLARSAAETLQTLLPVQGAAVAATRGALDQMLSVHESALAREAQLSRENSQAEMRVARLLSELGDLQAQLRTLVPDEKVALVPASQATVEALLDATLSAPR